jgi:hypothetical protein
MVVGHGNIPSDHGADGPAVKRLADEILTAMVRSLECPKHIARLDAAAVALHRSQRRIGHVAGRVAQTQPAANHSIELAKGRHGIRG